MADYDLAILGGGLNGVSVARDAAGRGLRVILLEQGDLGAGASSASPRVIDRGQRQVITARALANATGAWTASVAETVLRMLPPRVGTARISQIIVRRLFDTDGVYVFQNSDRRLIFASPYERDFTLIGTVGHAFKGDPAIVSMP